MILKSLPSFALTLENILTITHLEKSNISARLDTNPNCSRYIEKLEIKQEVMKLITHPDTEVRYHALSAVQKYLSGIFTAL
jgi:hypothetical protein